MSESTSDSSDAGLPFYVPGGLGLGASCSPDGQTRLSDQTSSGDGTPSGSSAVGSGQGGSSTPVQPPWTSFSLEELGGVEAAHLRLGVKKLLPDVDSTVQEILVSLMLRADEPWTNLKQSCLARSSEAGTAPFIHAGPQSPEFSDFVKAALSLPSEFSPFQFQVSQVHMR